MKELLDVMDAPTNLFPIPTTDCIDAAGKILHCGRSGLHEGGYAGPMKDQDKLRVMLVFWMGHNVEHAEEFRKWAQRAEAFGEKEVAAKLEEAAQEMILPNNVLRSALDMMGGPLERN
jgi:hypothetical protein